MACMPENTIKGGDDFPCSYSYSSSDENPLGSIGLGRRLGGGGGGGGSLFPS